MDSGPVREPWPVLALTITGPKGLAETGWLLRPYPPPTGLPLPNRFSQMAAH